MAQPPSNNGRRQTHGEERKALLRRQKERIEDIIRPYVIDGELDRQRPNANIDYNPYQNARYPFDVNYPNLPAPPPEPHHPDAAIDSPVHNPEPGITRDPQMDLDITDPDQNVRIRERPTITTVSPPDSGGGGNNGGGTGGGRNGGGDDDDDDDSRDAGAGTPHASSETTKSWRDRLHRCLQFLTRSWQTIPLIFMTLLCIFLLCRQTPDHSNNIWDMTKPADAQSIYTLPLHLAQSRDSFLSLQSNMNKSNPDSDHTIAAAYTAAAQGIQTLQTDITEYLNLSRPTHKLAESACILCTVLEAANSSDTWFPSSTHYQKMQAISAKADLNNAIKALAEIMSHSDPHLDAIHNTISLANSTASFTSPLRTTWLSPLLDLSTIAGHDQSVADTQSVLRHAIRQITLEQWKRDDLKVEMDSVLGMNISQGSSSEELYELYYHAKDLCRLARSVYGTPRQHRALREMVDVRYPL